MIVINIEPLLNKKHKSKYWLCRQMNITYKNLNRIINHETDSISFRYIEDFCKYLECSIDELISIKYVTNDKEL